MSTWARTKTKQQSSNQPTKTKINQPKQTNKKLYNNLVQHGDEHTLCSTLCQDIHCKPVFCPWDQARQHSCPVERSWLPIPVAAWLPGACCLQWGIAQDSPDGSERFWSSHIFTDSKWLSVICLEENSCLTHEICYEQIIDGLHFQRTLPCKWITCSLLTLVLIRINLGLLGIAP